MKARVRRLHGAFVRTEHRALARFNRWFCSEGGVYQTFLVTLAIVIAERVFPNLDHSGFWLLYWLTIYSAVTQPALAFSTNRDAEALERHLAELERQLAIVTAWTERQ